MEVKTRPIMVGFRVSDEERRTIEALAQTLERTMSDAMRYVMRQAARELLPEAATEATEGRPQRKHIEGNIDCRRR